MRGFRSFCLVLGGVLSLAAAAAAGPRFTQLSDGVTVRATSRRVLMTGKHLGNARVRGNAGGANTRTW